MDCSNTNDDGHRGGGDIRHRGPLRSNIGRGRIRGGARGGKSGNGKDRQRQQQRRRGQEAAVAPPPKRKVLLLHGNRQTGQLLLNRIERLRKKLAKLGVEIVAPDGPFEWSSERDPMSASHDVRNGDDGTEGKAKDEVPMKTRWHRSEEAPMRTWWHRSENTYEGLETSLDEIHALWSSPSIAGDGGGEKVNSEEKGCGFEGILGFSQGARLCHLIAYLHCASRGKLFHGLKYVILVSGYGGFGLPDNFPPFVGSPWEKVAPLASMEGTIVAIPSLHVMGLIDKLVPLDQSRKLLEEFEEPTVHEHDGGHHVPCKAGDCEIFLNFISTAASKVGMNAGNKVEKSDAPSAVSTVSRLKEEVSKPAIVAPKARTPVQPIRKQPTPKPPPPLPPNPIKEGPDKEHAQTQIDEVQALALIFPSEFNLLSASSIASGGDPNEYSVDDRTYVHPISYAVNLKPEHIEDDSLWPRGELGLEVCYPSTYPDVPPMLSLRHDMNLLEFKGAVEKACLDRIREAAMEEKGMPCVMGCVYAGREFFEGGGMAAAATASGDVESDTREGEGIEEGPRSNLESASEWHPNGPLAKSSPEKIAEANLQGLLIAQSVLKCTSKLPAALASDTTDSDSESGARKGGSWQYTIGLVGKPSAGKSTFFNAATAFARQRGAADKDGTLGGATMAPHPFTTIDPNVGYCLVPAPPGSCPEDDDGDRNAEVGCTHGRDSKGRRLIQVMLKDVAGLVPGAYQGRGRGNKFLDDLTDADVLIHVVDASGIADPEGNVIVGHGGYSGSAGSQREGGSCKEGGGSHPLDDLAWIRNELIEWVYYNLECKWDGIVRRGRGKLASMFTGYKQSNAFVWDVLLSVERYLTPTQDHALDHLDTWDESDLHRLVSAFLGARFPMALALNKSDLPSAKGYVVDVMDALPIHGAHVGVPLSAKDEMRFVRGHVIATASIKGEGANEKGEETAAKSEPPNGVWSCLQSALCLREPVLVFPVADMVTYDPLPGLNMLATEDPSLPNGGMISCLLSSGGSAPSHWDNDRGLYNHLDVDRPKQRRQMMALRDVVVMKPGSTVEDVFLHLKRCGALGGEYVRAEGASKMGEKPKLIPKHDLVGRHNRILKIMTNKRREWQGR